MNIEVAQIVALVAYGNLFLSGKDVDLSENTTLKYVYSIKFIRYKDNQDTRGVEVANNVSEWFSFLRSAKVNRLWHVDFRGWQRQDIPAYAASAFSGAIRNAIQADLPKDFEIWYQQWRGGGDEYKPWIVKYGSLISPNSYAPPVPEISVAKKRLKQAVLRARDFAFRKRWIKKFTESLESLESSAPTLPYPDMLPSSGFPLEARQLLASAAKAYLFGGMGSWYDMTFPNNPETAKRYEEITKELDEAIQFAIATASNSFTA